MVHRKSSSVMYTRILERTFGKSCLVVKPDHIYQVKNHQLNIMSKSVGLSSKILYRGSKPLRSYLSEIIIRGVTPIFFK